MAQKTEPTVGLLIAYGLQDHMAKNPGEPHGVDHCSICMLYSVLGVIVEAGALAEAPLRVVGGKT